MYPCGGQMQHRPFQHGSCRLEFTVRPCQLQHGRFLPVRGHQRLIRLQRHHAALGPPPGHPWGGFSLQAVDFFLCQLVKPLSHHPLIGRMDIVIFPLIQQADHPCVPHPVPRFALPHPQGRPGFAVFRAFFDPHRQLNKQERQFLRAEGGAPPVDQGHHQRIILLRPPGILLPLVIQDSRQRQRNQRCNHGLIQSGRPVGRSRTFRRIPGAWSDLRHQILPGSSRMCRLPGGHPVVPGIQGMPEDPFLLDGFLHRYACCFLRIFLQVPASLSRSPQPRLVHPAGHGSPAQVAVDDSHRHFQLPLHLHRKEIGNCADILSAAGADGIPSNLLPRLLPFRAEVSELRDVEIPDHWIHMPRN